MVARFDRHQSFRRRLLECDRHRPELRVLQSTQFHGQNTVAWGRLAVPGNAVDRITVRHGEMLNPDGTSYTANLRGANATDFYTFATKGPAIFEPRFTLHGFRYVEVRGLSVPPTLS